MKIDLRIEELVLDGFPAEDRHRVAAALQGELARLLTERGLPSGLAGTGAGEPRSIRSLDAGSFEMSTGKSLATVGRQAAASVYRGLKR